MKDFSVDPIHILPVHTIRPVSIGTRFCAWLTGSSLDELGTAPDAERRTVGLAGLVLILIFAACALSWWVALGIARGTYSLQHLPFVALAGLLVGVIDRAMLRQHWVRHGRRGAGQRGFDLPDARGGGVALVIHWLLRLTVSVVLGLTTAGFLELELFGQDITAHLADETQIANSAIYQEAAERHDAAATQVQAELEGLDRQARLLLEQEAVAFTAAQEAAGRQITALSDERKGLQVRVIQLTEAIDCTTTNRIAEQTGTQRCDGSIATAGNGDRWTAADQLAQNQGQERARAEARIGQIDAALAELGRAAPAVSPEVQAALSRLATLRSAAAERLAELAAARDSSILATVQADPRYVVKPDGLIVRGEALERLAESSPWLATRIWLVFGALVIIDLAAVIVIALQPPPLALVISETLASEVAAQEAIARATVATVRARLSALRPREALAAAEAATDEEIAKHDATQTIRRQMKGRLDENLRRAIFETSPAF